MNPYTLRMLALFGIKRSHPVLRISTYLLAGNAKHKSKAPSKEDVDQAMVERASRNYEAYLKGEPERRRKRAELRARLGANR